MRDELLTRHVVEQLELDPLEEGYFGATWDAIHQHERTALRRWRRASIALTVVALVAVGSAAAMLVKPQAAGAKVVEATLSCAAQPRAGLHKITVSGGVTVPNVYPGDVALWTVEKQIAGKVVSQLEFAATLGNVVVDRAACRTIHTVVPLAPAGLPSNGVVTPTFIGDFQDYCTVAASRVLVHYRVTFGPNGATAGRVAVRADNPKRTPLAYLDWKPNRLASFLSSRCTTPH